MRLPVLLSSLVIWALVGCTPLRQAGVDVSRHTGIVGAVSDQVVVSDHPHHVLVGQAMILQRDGRAAFVVDVGQINRGHARLRMTDAWWNGRTLPFHGARRGERFCTGPRDCGGFRTGVFSFSRAGFAAAARHGFDARLTGPDAGLDIHVPGRVFAQALEQAARM